MLSGKHSLRGNAPRLLQDHSTSFLRLENSARQHPAQPFGINTKCHVFIPISAFTGHIQMLLVTPCQQQLSWCHHQGSEPLTDYCCCRCPSMVTLLSGCPQGLLQDLLGWPCCGFVKALGNPKREAPDSTPQHGWGPQDQELNVPGAPGQTPAWCLPPALPWEGAVLHPSFKGHQKHPEKQL